MGSLPFILLSAVWLGDMAALTVAAPLGNNHFIFSVLFIIGHILMILMVWFFPTGGSSRKAFAIVVVLGIAARLIFLFYPVGNDVYRYIWEGYIQNHGVNPYRYAPVNPALAEIARGDLYPIWHQINHPEFSAAYPPVSLMLFRIIAWIKPDPFFFKTVMTGFDIAVMFVLMPIINQRGLPPWRLLLYSANPLVLLYISGEGHLDIIQVFFLCLALYFILCKKYHISGFLMLGLAILSKYFALVALPFLVSVENRKQSLSVLLPLALYIPFMDAGYGIFQSLGEFGANFHYNDAMAALIRYLFGNHHYFITMLLLLICLLWVYLFVHDRLRSVYLAMGCLIVLLPTLHPWYLVLIAPFLVFFPSRAWLYLQAAVAFTFPAIAVEYSSGVFQEISWLKLFEYVPFYGLLVYGLIRGGLFFREKSYTPPKSISVIIPTLNESGNLARCLKSLNGRTALTEVIAADGGSVDGTPEIAANLDARVVESPKGRGFQIRKGIEAASGDVIVIMHADCRAEKGVFKQISDKLASEDSAVGGAVGMRFERASPRTTVIAFLNNLRAFLTGISFGDQAQFFRKEVLDSAGGFPSIMLMEDVELALRLKEVGRLIFLRRGIVVSGRRWHGDRFSGNLRTVIHLFTRYLIGRRFSRKDALKRNFYDIYYS